MWAPGRARAGRQEANTAQAGVRTFSRWLCDSPQIRAEDAGWTRTTNRSGRRSGISPVARAHRKIGAWTVVLIALVAGSSALLSGLPSSHAGPPVTGSSAVGPGVGWHATSMGRARLSASPSSFAVRSTLVLFNNTLVPGNFLAGNGFEPIGVAYDSGKGEVFVANSGSDNVSVISDATNAVVATVLVGTTPEGVAYDSGKGEVFVANLYSDNVSVISDATNAVVATVAVGYEPTAVAYDSGKGEVSVVNYEGGSDNVSVISDATDTVVAWVAVGSEPDGVAFDASNGYVYVTNFDQGTLSVLSAVTPPTDYTVAFTESGLPASAAWSVTLAGTTNSSTTSTITFSDPNGTYSFTVGSVTGYIASPSYGALTVTGAPVSQRIVYTSVAVPRVVATVPVGAAPAGSAYDSANGYVYVADSNSSAVSVLSGTSVVASVAIGGFPSYVTYDSGDGYVYVASYPTDTSQAFNESGNVSVIDGETVVARLPVGLYPGPMTYDSGNGYVYVPNDGGNTVSVLSGTSVVATVTVADFPWMPAYDSADGYVYVPSTGYCPAGCSGSVTVLNGTSVVTTVPIGSATSTTEVAFAAYDDATGSVYVSSCVVNAQSFCVSGNVTIIYGTSTVGTIASPATAPDYEIVDPVTGYVYVGNYNSSSVSVIHGASLLTTVSVGALPYWGTFDAADGYVYICNTDNVSVLDGPSVVATVAVGSFADWATYDSSNSYVYVSNFDSNNVSLLGTSITAKYSVSFTESGLPTGSNWSVTLNGTTGSASAPGSIAFNEPNGTYSFTIGGVAGYSANPLSGSVTVDGAAVTVSIGFSPLVVATYAVTFTESGLPTGTSWSVALNGVTQSGSGGSIAFMEANGTYSFSIGVVSGYTASPSFGSVTVNGGSPPTQTVTFTPISTTKYAVTVIETGLPTGSLWNVTLYGLAGSYSANGTGASILVPVPNGTYTYLVEVNTSLFSSYILPTGFFAVSELLGNVSVAGAPVSIAAEYSSVTFTETGLPSTATWTVIGATNLTQSVYGGTSGEAIFYAFGITAQMSWYVPFGTYTFEVCQNLSVSANGSSCSNSNGYTPNPQRGIFTASGTPHTQSVTFSRSGSGSGSAKGSGGGLPPILGLPGVEGYVVVGTTVAVAVIVGVLVAIHSYAAVGGAAVAGGAGGRRALRRRRKDGKTPPPSAAAPPATSAGAPPTPPPADAGVGPPPPPAPPPPPPASATAPAASAVCWGCGKPYVGAEKFCTSCGRPR